MEEDKRAKLLQQYQHLLSYYKHIPQEQINNWVIGLITSQTKHITELFTNFVCEGFFRARKHNILEGIVKNDETEFLTCESQFWNPPRDLCRLGRCNDIHESLFYCSPELSTAVIETRPQKGDFLSIAQFKRKNPDSYKGARIKYIGIKTLSKIPSIKHILNKDYEKDAEELELDETLDDLFHKEVSSEDRELYRLSVAVTKSMMTTLFDPDQEVYYEMHGLIYSSIQCNRKGINIVYRPEHVKQHFGVAQVRTFEVIESNGKTITIKEQRIGNMKPTRILDPFDYHGINWQRSNKEVVLKFDK